METEFNSRRMFPLVLIGLKRNAHQIFALEHLRKNINVNAEKDNEMT
jgi:hypothetical protein